VPDILAGAVLAVTDWLLLWAGGGVAGALGAAATGAGVGVGA